MSPGLCAHTGFRDRGECPVCCFKTNWSCRSNCPQVLMFWHGAVLSLTIIRQEQSCFNRQWKFCLNNNVYAGGESRKRNAAVITVITSNLMTTSPQQPESPMLFFFVSQWAWFHPDNGTRWGAELVVDHFFFKTSSFSAKVPQLNHNKNVFLYP